MDRRGIIDKDGVPAASFERPEMFDVLVFDPVLNELRINASSIGEKRLYRDQWGIHLFGGKDYFAEGGKYTLAPLAEGPDSITCEDFDSMEWIKLVEIHISRGGAYNEVEIRKASDYFAVLEKRGWTLQGLRLFRAKFQVKFTQQKNPRMLTVKPPRIAQFAHDEDSAVLDAWLQKRGFARGPVADEGE